MTLLVKTTFYLLWWPFTVTCYLYEWHIFLVSTVYQTNYTILFVKWTRFLPSTDTQPEYFSLFTLNYNSSPFIFFFVCHQQWKKHWVPFFQVHSHLWIEMKEKISFEKHSHILGGNESLGQFMEFLKKGVDSSPG